MKWVQLWLILGIANALAWSGEIRDQCHSTLGYRGTIIMVLLGPTIPVTLIFPKAECGSDGQLTER